MNKFTSYTSAIIAGAVCTPVLIVGVDYIEKNSKSQLLQFAWFIIWFFLPVLISTVDFDPIRKRAQKRNTFYELIRIWTFTAEDAKELGYPTWKRMFAYFISACISALFLKFTGFHLG